MLVLILPQGNPDHSLRACFTRAGMYVSATNASQGRDTRNKRNQSPGIQSEKRVRFDLVRPVLTPSRYRIEME